MTDESLQIALPFLIPLASAVLSLSRLGSTCLSRTVLLMAQCAASLVLLVRTLELGAVATAAGDWLAPFGIVLIADPLAALLLVTSSVVMLCCAWDFPNPRPLTFPLIFFLQAGVSLSFLTGDVFNLFVAFEIMLMSSYALLVLHGKKEKLANASSYLFVNVTASFLFLIAVAVLYTTQGSLNFADLAVQLRTMSGPLALIAPLALLMVMLIKGGVFPFYFWLPDSYPLLPARLAAIFGGILSKVGLYVVFRIWILMVPQPPPWLYALLLGLASFTMLFGVLGAVSKASVKEILCYHILSQVGYILMAVTLRSPLAMTAGLFFMVHNMVVKSSLLLLGGIAAEKCGSGRLEHMGGLWRHAPFLGLLFLVQAFSLSGVPPLSGFWPKFLLFFEGLRGEAYLSVAAGVLTSFLTLFSMIKIWGGAFQGDFSREHNSHRRSSYLGPIALTALAVSIGLGAYHSVHLSQTAADIALNRDVYIQTALNSGQKGAIR